jgi:hypothetical protein
MNTANIKIGNRKFGVNAEDISAYIKNYSLANYDDFIREINIVFIGDYIH